MRDLVDGFKELLIFVFVIVILFVGWAVSGGFTPLDFLVLAAVLIHYVFTFKLGMNKFKESTSLPVEKNDDAPITIRR